jgi:predicted transcriptional regulator
MIAKTYTVKKVRYFVSNKEKDMICNYLNERGLNPSRYATLKGISKSTFCRVLDGLIPMTDKMYNKVFKEFNCIEAPSSFIEEND